MSTAPTGTAPTGTVHAALTRHDRCDRCTAAAQVVAVIPNAGELLFCGHHTRVHAARLRDIGAEFRLGR
ncbi:DUF7455 domain-containing protein [Pseudonocardia sichuanensis]|uniref:DUF7455 domain-containing protein n=1 Tax=Pseudonocardia kunmingensis TaxID=630975 RepID=A0A543DZC4_9PSEU|nr:hypothetical protein [Pseudonocardia kunmingensis]TQM14711.1 hypothetical protein FB558_1485 [Pseudonocardia kunmingensis]